MSVHERANGTVFVRYRENGKQQNRTFGKGAKARAEATAFDLAVKKKKEAQNQELRWHCGRAHGSAFTCRWPGDDLGRARR